MDNTGPTKFIKAFLQPTKTAIMTVMCTSLCVPKTTNFHLFH